MYVLVSFPSFWHTAPKTLTISWMIGVSLTLMRWLGGLLDGSWLPERRSHDQKCGLFNPTSHSPKRGEGLEMELMINHVTHEASVKIPKIPGSESSGVVNTWSCWKSGTPERACKLYTSSLTCISSPGCSSLSFISLYNEPVNSKLMVFLNSVNLN